MNLGIMWRVLRLTWAYQRKMSLAVLLSVLTIISSIGLMASAAWLISKAALQPSIADLGLAPVLVRLFGISRAVFRYLERLVSHDVTFRILARIRVWFYAAIEPLAPARLSEFRSGDLLQRVVSDVDQLENIYGRVLSPPLVAVFVAVLITVLFWGFDLVLALVMLAFLVFTATSVSWWTLWGGQHSGREMVALQAQMSVALVDSIQGIADSVAFGHTEVQLAELNQINDELRQREIRMAWLDGLQSGFVVLATNLAALTILVVAIPQVDGLFLATLTLATLAAFEAVIPLGTAIQYLGANQAAAARLFEIVDSPLPVSEPSGPSPQSDHYDVVVHNLSFGYGPRQPLVFDRLNLEIKSNDRVAIIGPSGSGKSTLVNLLLRFWDYESGSIMVGGYDLREYHQQDVHKIVSVMTQEVHLFNTTIRENIWLANDTASEEQVVAAAKHAQIHDFIMTLPKGYRTFTGERGVQLSGGQRQRIALARVLLRDAPILILDEPTANLDSITEQNLLDTILDVTQNRTLIMITHRHILTRQFANIIKLTSDLVVP